MKKRRGKKSNNLARIIIIILLIIFMGVVIYNLSKKDVLFNPGGNCNWPPTSNTMGTGSGKILHYVSSSGEWNEPRLLCHNGKWYTKENIWSQYGITNVNEVADGSVKGSWKLVNGNWEEQIQLDLTACYWPPDNPSAETKMAESNELMVWEGAAENRILCYLGTWYVSHIRHTEDISYYRRTEDKLWGYIVKNEGDVVGDWKLLGGVWSKEWVEEQEEQTCVDSDVSEIYPDGKNYYKKGNVTSGGGFYEDFCSKDVRLYENYCEGGFRRVTSSPVYCNNGCEDGKCNEPYKYEATITNLVPENYVITKLNIGDKYYSDEDYVILNMPSWLEGKTAIMTSNKNSQEVRFHIDKASRVYLMWDAREPALSEWFYPVGDEENFQVICGVKENIPPSVSSRFKVSDVGASCQGVLILTGRNFDAGEVIIPKKNQGSNYVIFIISREEMFPYEANFVAEGVEEEIYGEGEETGGDVIPNSFVSSFSCGNCGEGILNICDSKECYDIGDCNFNSRLGKYGVCSNK